MNAGGDVLLITDRVHLVLKAFVDPDVGWLDAGEDELANGLCDDDGVGADGGRTGAIDLEPDDIIRFDEASPRGAEILFTGEGDHATAHHFLDGGDVNGLRRDVDRLRRVDSGDATAEGSGHARLGPGLVGRLNAILR